MSLVEWNPFKELDNFGKEMGNWFERFPFRFLSASTPKVDVYETDTDLIMKAEIPGVSKEDLNVYVDENSIRLSGQTKRSDEFKDDQVYRSERYYGSFSRTIPLPVEIKADQVSAKYKDGILTITAPKVEPSKTKSRRIDIQ
ncbi:MAG TPA: Hsp20/alpha crystallin family protein [Clostridiaceae bacterium]|nr:Hsp20/alpha crystallin family protein [Clostridiaceae bacterium]